MEERISLMHSPLRRELFTWLTIGEHLIGDGFHISFDQSHHCLQKSHRLQCSFNKAPLDYVVSFRHVSPITRLFPFVFFFIKWKHSRAIRALFVMSLPLTNVFCSSSIISGKICLTLLAIVFVTNFMITLQRLVGLNSLWELRFLPFRIREMKVLLTLEGSGLLLRISKTKAFTSFAII